MHFERAEATAGHGVLSSTFVIAEEEDIGLQPCHFGAQRADMATLGGFSRSRADMDLLIISFVLLERGETDISLQRLTLETCRKRDELARLVRGRTCFYKLLDTQARTHGSRPERTICEVASRPIHVHVIYNSSEIYCTMPSTVPTGRSVIAIHPSTMFFLASSELTF